MASTGVITKTAVATSKMINTKGQAAFWLRSRRGVEGGGVNDAIELVSDRLLRLDNPAEKRQPFEFRLILAYAPAFVKQVF
jgi:hypothetical protein